jgi:hypothetical protein
MTMEEEREEAIRRLAVAVLVAEERCGDGYPCPWCRESIWRLHGEDPLEGHADDCVSRLASHVASESFDEVTA